ncbi:ABC-F family ATP-binding cassette domain-containing protein [Pseudomonas cremoricolorata]|uniref:ABC transporter ATP-binding protein n=1 Tax=Pseudomonas cremoricolorata TaxID=157783 RepID=A0A089WWE8_9PSED|nr:ATP-binding cassette domain-containing protein [Pseudomonas cremoricolorata]AIR90937.1 ABC transporter ATP-binding protein [Pseudomonas cremoricolorata]
MTPSSLLTLDSVACTLPNGRVLFSDLTVTLDQRHTALVGRNGVGKSLLGQILAGQRLPSEGRCLRYGRIHLLDQQIIHHSRSVAELAQVAPVLDALQRIAQGSTDPADFDAVGERWNLAEQLQMLFARHGLGALDPHAPVDVLSPGQAMRVAVLGAFLSDADYLILDEPSNHLDHNAREQLQTLISQWPRGLLLISHDRTLLEPLQRTLELTAHGLLDFTGGYSAYQRGKAEQQARAEQALGALKAQCERQAQAARQQREKLQRQQSRGQSQARQANQAQILLDRQQQRSQTSTGKRQQQLQHAEAALQAKVREAAQRVEQPLAIHLRPPDVQRHAGRPVLQLDQLRLPYGNPAPLDLRLLAGERMAVTGANGSGKSTLLQVISGQLAPRAGEVRVHGSIALLDQHASLLPGQCSVIEYLRRHSPGLDHSQLRTRLAQLGLDATRVELPSHLLSGGERVKAALAALLYRPEPVDLLLLDEPGNHLDLLSLQAVEQMLGQFRGALLVVSHDQVFLQQIALDGRLSL